MEPSEHFIDESLVINKSYFETLKSQLSCLICSGLLSSPLLCSNCEIAYCQHCINAWISTNDTCPMRCQTSKCSIIPISRLMKNLMENTQLKCKYGCEVSLLSYPEHRIKCEFIHKDDVNCKYCGKNSDVLKLKSSNTQLMKENINMKIEALELNLRFEEEILRSKLEMKLIKVEEFNRVKKELDDVTIEYNFTQLKILEVMKGIKLKIDELKQERELFVGNGDDLNFPSLQTLQHFQKNGNDLFDIHGINGIDSVTEVLESKEKKIVTRFRKTNDNPSVEFTNDNKTIKLKQYGWVGIICDEKVGEHGAYEIDFKIDSTNYFGYIILGFATGGTELNNGFYTTNKCWMFDLRDGYLFNNDASDSNCYLIPGCKPKSGDVISLCIDVDLEAIYIKFNGVIYSYKKKMKNLDSFKKQNLYPCVDFYSYNDQISLI